MNTAASYRDIVESMPKCFRIPQWRLRQMCGATVEIFSGIMKQTLWLKHADQGATDCERWIWVNLSDPECYVVTCHEISHPYFCATDDDTGCDFEWQVHLDVRIPLTPRSIECSS
tara:strand:+ start:434 stop:778 length:345 start_codon:yes stop_codon:yes gene_type:complete